MAKTHPRSPSPEPKTGGLKRLKIGHPSDSTSNAVPSPVPGPASPQDVIACFAPDLFDASNVDSLAAAYSTSEPFKHALIEKLFCDHLLHQVKDECLSELHFTEKETDIYKARLRRPSLSPLPPLLLLNGPFSFVFVLSRFNRQAISHLSTTSANNSSRSSQTSSSSATRSTRPSFAISCAPSRAVAPSRA